MSNIVTEFVRVYAWPGHRISRDEAEWIVEQVLGEAGSYWVPVTVELGDDATYTDIQYGSGKGGRLGPSLRRRLGQLPRPGIPRVRRGLVIHCGARRVGRPAGAGAFLTVTGVNR